MSEPIRRYSVPQVERLSELNRWCRDEDVADLEAKLGAIERDRDELWCRALTTLEDAHMIQRVLERFDQLRPDKLAAAQEEKE